MAINVFKDTNSHKFQKVKNLTGVILPRLKVVTLAPDIATGLMGATVYDGTSGSNISVVIDPEILETAIGYVAVSGSTVNVVDTSAYNPGDLVYSDVNGNFTPTQNGNAIGVVIEVDASFGVIRLFLNGEELFGVRAMDHKITNFTLASADTEGSHVLTAGVKQISFRARNGSRLQFSFVSGDSGTNYMTVQPGAVYNAVDLNLAASTLYMQSSLPSTIVEIEEWY